MRTAALFLLLSQSCFAWSEGGHHLIGVMAFDLLGPQPRRAVIEVLKSHPLREKFLTVPGSITDQIEIDHWLIGQASYWPDTVQVTAWERPKWHYNPGATLVIGDISDLPKPPGPLPEDATLASRDLYITQAIELCQKVLTDKSQPAPDRAVALCWLCHLVADAHQPCHAGSLYHAIVFPKGDRGGNEIPTKQGKNLHLLWDGLLGAKYDAGDIRRRAIDIKNDHELSLLARGASRMETLKNPIAWIQESADHANGSVYTSEIIAPIRLVERELAQKLEPIDLSDDYLKAAGKIARRRAAFAAYRLAVVLAQSLAVGKSD